MRPDITVIMQREGLSVSVRQYREDGTAHGFTSFLTFEAAVMLADALNDALDDPDEDRTKRLLKR